MRLKTVTLFLIMALSTFEAGAATLEGVIAQDFGVFLSAGMCKKGQDEFASETFMQKFPLQYSQYMANTHSLSLTHVLEVSTDAFNSAMAGLAISPPEESQCSAIVRSYRQLLGKVGISEQDLKAFAEADVEKQRLAAEAEAEKQRLAARAEAEAVEAEAEARLRVVEAEAEKQRLAAEAMAEARRRAAEADAERQRLAAGMEAEKQRLAAEEEDLRKSLEERAWINSVGMKFVPIPAGEMRLSKKVKDDFGEEVEKEEIVKIAAFSMGMYEVTQEEWVAVMGGNPSEHKGRTLPVTYVGEYGVHEFARRLNEKEGHQRYRLPTELEWQYAALAGADPKQASFIAPIAQVTPDLLAQYAWFMDNTRDNKPRPVGQLLPNPWGLFDILGNVKEWTQDSKSGPRGKGGSYASRAYECTTMIYTMGPTGPTCGLRLVLDPEPGR